MFVLVCVSLFLNRTKQRQQETSWEQEAGEADEELEALLGMPLNAALGSVDRVHGEAIVLAIVCCDLLVLLVISCCACYGVFIHCVLVLIVVHSSCFVMCCA